MQTPIVISPYQRIPTLTVHIQSSGTGHQDLVLVPINIENSLGPTFPTVKLVQLIENQKMIHL